MYLSEINHRDQSYSGEHKPILDRSLFDAVQAKLNQNLRTRTLTNERSQALLLSKLFDDRGNRMTPSYAIKKGVRYRYYVSRVLAQGRKDEAGSVSRVAAIEIDTIVANLLASHMKGGEYSATSQHSGNSKQFDEPSTLNSLSDNSSAELLTTQAAVEKYIEKVVIGSRSLQIQWVEEHMNQGILGGPQWIEILETVEEFNRPQARQFVRN